MAVEGTYGFVYCGTNGLGIGVFTVSRGFGNAVGVAGAGCRGPNPARHFERHPLFRRWRPHWLAGVMRLELEYPCANDVFEKS
jgi:hypothetical protein